MTVVASKMLLLIFLVHFHKQMLVVFNELLLLLHAAVMYNISEQLLFEELSRNYVI